MQFDQRNLFNDIAIAKLATPFVFKSHVQPIAIASKEKKLNNASKCAIIRWGWNSGTHSMIQL